MSKALTPIEDLRRNLKALEPQFKMALPAHVTVERFTRIIVTAIQTSPSLLNANRASLYAACMKAAQDGLLPDGKDAALVPFKDTVQYMPMVSGILKKVRNSGELASITSQIVHKNDTFKYWIDSNGEHLEHSPNMFEERGPVQGVYALAKMKDGSVYIEVLTMSQVEQVKKVSRSKDSGPWGSFPEEMMKKTAIRRLSKRLPMSTDLEIVIKRDDDLYDLDTQPEENTVNEIKEETPSLNKLIAKQEESQAETSEVEKKDIPI